MSQQLDSFLSDIFIKHTKEISNKKTEILLQRINERVKLPDDKKFTEEDLIMESRRKFPRIMAQKQYDLESESYYWNDGSDMGIHLVTFIVDKPTLTQYMQPNGYGLEFKIKFK